MGAIGINKTLIAAFLYLQVLDVMSTLIGFSLGNPESSPFVRLLVQVGPIAGLILSKLVAIALAGACVLLNRIPLIRVINYWYAAVVIWNLYASLRVLNS